MASPMQDPELGWRDEIDWTPGPPPATRRILELRRIRRKNRRKRLPQMHGAHLNRMDVEWLIQENRGPVRFGDDQLGHGGLDLRGANLAGADCANLPLADTLLQHARLENSDFSKSDLRWAFFNEAHMSEANFTDACLYKAHFDGAYMRSVNMTGSDLRSAWLDDKTYLDGIRLNGAFLAGCRWRGADVTMIPWEELRILGEENSARCKPAELREAAYEKAADAYGRLAQLLRDQGRRSEASRLSFRSALMRRRSTTSRFKSNLRAGNLIRATRSLPSLVGQLAMEVVSGYGEVPSRAITCMLLVTGMFAILYLFVGSTPDHPFNILSALAFSASSFLGRGYALVLPFSTLAQPISVLSTIEAAIGLIVEVLFVASLTRRVIGR